MSKAWGHAISEVQGHAMTEVRGRLGFGWRLDDF